MPNSCNALAKPNPWTRPKPKVSRHRFCTSCEKKFSAATIDDRSGDRGLDDRAGNPDDIQGGKRKRDRMTDGEGGDQLDDGPQAVRPQDDGDQKGDMVVADQDMFDPRSQV